VLFDGALYTSVRALIGPDRKSMKPASLALVGLVLLLTTTAFGQEAPEGTPPPTPAPAAAPPPPTAPPPATPEGAVGVTLPPPPLTPVAPEGQWVYTAQYGWVWMPSSEAYLYRPYDEYGDPFMFVYYPLGGWRWVAAPWVFGIGPHPYFGSYGWRHYGWYGQGWYGHTWYGYRSGYPRHYRGVVYVHERHGGGAWSPDRHVVAHVQSSPATPRGNVAHAVPSGNIAHVEHGVPAQRAAPVTRPAPVARPQNIVRPAPAARPQPVARPQPAARPQAVSRPSAPAPRPMRGGGGGHGGGGHGGGHHR
jgi:hypothetical protein